MAHIKNLRGKKRWLATVFVKPPDRPAVRREKLFPDASNKSKHAALKWETEERQRILSESEKETNTVSLTAIEWIDEYLDDVKRRKMSDKTYDEKRTAFVRFSQHEAVTGSLPVEKIDRFLAKSHFDGMLDTGRTGNAVNKDRKNLGVAWNWGRDNFKDWPVGENPFLSVSKYPSESKQRYVPPESDFWAVTDYLRDGYDSGRPEKVQDYVMHMAYLHLAARRGELFGMTLSDLDFEKKLVRLWTRKRAGGEKQGDWLPMTSELKELLLEWTRVKMETGIRSNHVFVNCDPSPVCVDLFGKPFVSRQRFLPRVCKKLKITPFNYHAIRHFSASYLYQKGYPVWVIQSVLRHKNPNTTARYLRKLGLEQNEVRDALEGGFKNAEIIDLAKTKAPKSGTI